MKCEEKDEAVNARARSQLSMLRLRAARRDFLRETRAMTHYYRMRRTLYRHRVCPYAPPNRHRTNSENSDSKEAVSDETCQTDKTGLKRCQSLESLNKVEAEIRELDRVSNGIERLQVNG